MQTYRIKLDWYLWPYKSSPKGRTTPYLTGKYSLMLLLRQSEWKQLLPGWLGSVPPLTRTEVGVLRGTAFLGCWWELHIWHWRGSEGSLDAVLWRKKEKWIFAASTLYQHCFSKILFAKQTKDNPVWLWTTKQRVSGLTHKMCMLNVF